MNKLAIFQRQASVDANVTLRLTRGDDVSGRIAELDDTHVRLDLGGGKTVTVFEDILAGWEIHRESGIGVRSDRSGEPLPAAAPAGRIPASRACQQAVSDGLGHEDEPPPGTAEGLESRGGAGHPVSGPESPVSPRDSRVLAALAKNEATFSEAIKRARLDPPEPDLAFPAADFPSRDIEEVRREWDRARNQYAYALKMKELARLNSILVQILEPLSRRYPDSAATKSFLGRVLLELDRRSEAKDHLAAAAALSETSGHWLSLAFAAGDDTAAECYALRQYFHLTIPSQETEAWYRYLGAAIAHRDLQGIVQVIHHWSERKVNDPELCLLLAESLVYVLTSSGAESHALGVAANLVQAGGGLPPGWKDVLERGADPSEELQSVERKISRLSTRSQPPTRPIRPNGESLVPHGRVASFFFNQRFGFIDAEEETFFFRIDSVKDERLSRALLDGSWRTFGEVEFEVVPSRGQKYSRARNIVQLQNRESLLQEARSTLKLGQHSQALHSVRRVLRADPGDEIATQLEKEITKDFQRQLKEHGVGLPKGKGPYARAKRAELVQRDFENAELLFNQAIRERDNRESAIKDLASLLQRQGKADDAISLLRKWCDNKNDIDPMNNMLVALYQHADRYDEAIEVLVRLSEAAPETRKPSLLRQMAYSQFKCGRYDDAEQTLRELLAIDSNNRTATRWLAGLKDARTAGSEETEEFVEAFEGLTEEGAELSPLAKAAIRNCAYEGVDAAKIQAGTAGAQDIARVEELAKTLGTRRPRDRAAYYLSAAALLEKSSDKSEHGRIYSYLRRYFTSMADAAWIEKKPADVVRSYYVESFTLVFDDNLDEAWRSLFRYLATFSPAKAPDVESFFPRGHRGHTISREKYTRALQKTLEMIGPEAGAGWLEGAVAGSSHSSFVRRSIGDAVLENPPLLIAFAGLLGTTSQEADEVRGAWESRCRKYAQARRQRLSLCRTFLEYKATAASMEDLGAQLRNAIAGTESKVDRLRLNSLADIVRAALAFCTASDDFEERERNYWLVTQQADRFREEVTDAPTQYSWEGLLPVSDHVKSLIEEEYAEMARTSTAALNLRLLVERYQRGQEGDLRLQIEVANRHGCSPASSVRILLAPKDSEYFDAPHWEREVISTLRGGTTEVAQMTIRPKTTSLKDRAFPVSARAIYQDRLGEEKSTEEYPWTVRLYRDEEFQDLRNPYAPFAEGGPVDDAEMFVGREELLARLESSLLSGAGSKSVVMFGQKRAGKSSLIEHLRRRFSAKQRVVPVCFSLQDIAPELSMPALLYRILQGLSDALEDLRFDGIDVPEFSPPGIETLERHPALRFHDFMSSLVRSLKRHSSDFEIVLLADEFTDIFKAIRNGRVPRTFMKAWKAIIEKKYFSSVLVGQDIMPAFKAEFPNEFGVTEDVRVTYLDDAAAKMLVQRPIGEERFAGRAVTRLLELTAGSPYYTMMFCARLVDYMNDTRSVIVTEADIQAVETEMLRGNRRLTRDKFDNLLCAGDGEEDSGIDPEDTYAVCSAIARGSGRRGWCSRDLIKGFDGAALDGLLSDLETREVVERKETAYRLRVELFRDWLVLQG